MDPRENLFLTDTCETENLIEKPISDNNDNDRDKKMIQTITKALSDHYRIASSSAMGNWTDLDCVYYLSSERSSHEADLRLLNIVSSWEKPTSPSKNTLDNAAPPFWYFNEILKIQPIWIDWEKVNSYQKTLAGRYFRLCEADKEQFKIHYPYLYNYIEDTVKYFNTIAMENDRPDLVVTENSEISTSSPASNNNNNVNAIKAHQKEIGSKGGKKSKVNEALMLLATHEHTLGRGLKAFTNMLMQHSSYEPYEGIDECSEIYLDGKTICYTTCTGKVKHTAIATLKRYFTKAKE